jgi:DNA adenine methylase Dam
MKIIDVYNRMKKDRLDNPSLTTKEKEKKNKENAKLIMESFGIKSGKFAESLCRETIKTIFPKYTKGKRIENLPPTVVKQYFDADGYIPELDMYIECKNYQFYSSGTANEKLWGWFPKLQHYDKPCILVFSGEHELLSFDECSSIMGIYKNKEKYKQHIYYDTIRRFVEEKKLYVIRNKDREQGWSNTNRFEKAARTVYLNKTCFNGLFRVNKSGFSNVPFGSGRKGDVLPLTEAEAFSNAIKDVNFSCMGYLDFLETAQSGDLVYLDPPYVDTKNPKKEFNGYVGGFGWAEQKQLIIECERLQKLGCTVVVSNSYCNETLELYKDFEINIIEAPRYISCKKDGRKPVKEIVAVLK